jgi:hypothetical protein
VDLLAAKGGSPAKGAEVFQVYRKGEGARLERVYAGAGPVYSEVMGVWWREEGGEIRLTRDKEGKERLPTKEEAETGKKQRAEAKAKAEAEARRVAEEARRAAEAKVKEEAQARRLAEEEALTGAREAILDLCELLAIEVTPERRVRIAALDLAALRQLRSALKLQKHWPG